VGWVEGEESRKGGARKKSKGIRGSGVKRGRRVKVGVEYKWWGD